MLFGVLLVACGSGSGDSAGVPTYSASGVVEGDTTQGVTMNLGGQASATVTTDESGNYNFPSLADGNYTLTPVRIGYTFDPGSVDFSMHGGKTSRFKFKSRCNNGGKFLLGGTIQGTPLNLTTVVTTFAGSGTAGAVDGTGIAASFNPPAGITTDGSNLYVTDQKNHKIRKIVIATGVVTTVAGTGVAGAVDGTGTAASFNIPSGITNDGTNLYVSDQANHKIRKIVIATGVVTTVAGRGVAGFAEGTGTAASFNFPSGITTDGTNLYVSDRDNHKIRQIVIATGVVSTVAGSGVAGAAEGTGAAASFNTVSGITTDGIKLYVVDNQNYKIRQVVIATGVVTTIAGSGTAFHNDGTGAAASFNSTTGISTDGSNLYIAEVGGYTIRKIVIASGVVTTLAGGGGGSNMPGAVDGTGTAASFNQPYALTTDGSSLYVTDSGNNKIRRIQ